MHGKFDDLGRFADPSVLILTSLSDGPKHGYAIIRPDFYHDHGISQAVRSWPAGLLL